MVLVVDDHGDTREALVRLLKREGYDAIGVKCGGEALLFLQTHAVGLVVLDYHMPDMDGLAVLADMRRDPRLAEVPVILFTADIGRLKERAMQQGVNAYVEKGTLDWGRLLAEVRRLAGQTTPQVDAPQVGEVERPDGLRKCEG